MEMSDRDMLSRYLGGDVDEESGSLRDALAAERWQTGALAGKAIFSVPVALSVMVFFALCMQCASTLVTIARESHWRWAVFTFAYMTVLAWGGAVLTFQVASHFKA